MSNRHRRTRIYGANYNIGESYYKKQLDDLDSRDNKSFPDSDYNLRVDKNGSKVSFFTANSDDCDDELTAGLAKKKPVFQHREYEKKPNDFYDDIVQSSVKSSYVKKLMPLALDHDKKGASDVSFSSKYEMSSVKEGTEDVEASRRVKVTKARLLNLEQEMVDRTEKQNEREKRNQNLKKLLSSTYSQENYKLDN